MTSDRGFTNVRTKSARVAMGVELPKIPENKGKSTDPNKGTRKGLTDPMDEKRGFKKKRSP